MDTLENFKRLYLFNDWANRILVRSIRDAESVKATEYLAHVLITEREYHERLFGKDSTGFDFWPKLSIDECAILARENADKYERLLDGFDDEGLGQVIRYKTSEGTPFENSYREILKHVLLHSMTHRGQILTLLRLAGHTPPAIDYIVYERTRS